MSIRHDLRDAVVVQGIRRIDRFTGRYSCAVEQWATDPVDPFFNDQYAAREDTGRRLTVWSPCIGGFDTSDKPAEWLIRS